MSASGISWYGPRGDERVDESTPAVHDDFMTQLAVDWEAAADEAAELGMRVVKVRTGIALADAGGALSKMLPPFKLGVGGPVAGGEQYMSWIHVDDVVGIYLAALDDERWSGPVNATAPEPVTNREFSKALGRALHRPALAPVPGFAIKALYGEMGTIVTTGQRAVPARATELGYAYAHPDLDEALKDALAALRERASGAVSCLASLCDLRTTQRPILIPSEPGLSRGYSRCVLCPNGPSFFQTESSRAGQKIQITTPITSSSSPEASPGRSP